MPLTTARRVPPAALLGGAGTSPDYASAFEAVVSADGAGFGTAGAAARAVFEQAPAALRLPVVAGWRWVFRLRLGPSHSPEHVAGWRVVEESPGEIVLDVDSPLIRARKVVRVESRRVSATTYVWYRTGAGRVAWTTLSVVHHQVEPLLLGLAARRPRQRVR